MTISDSLGAPVQSTREGVAAGAVLARLWLGAEPGALQLEVQELAAEKRPTVQTMRRAWGTRRQLRGNPVLIFWEDAGREALVCGPTAEEEQSVPVTTLPSETLAAVLRLGLAAPRAAAVSTIRDLLDRAQGSGDEPGFRNRGLVSTHCTLVAFRRNNPARWQRLAHAASRLNGNRSVDLLRSLGYQKVVAPGTFVYEQDGRVIVYATSLAAGVPIDRTDEGSGRTAAAELLANAREHHAKRAVIVMGRVVRTYVLDSEEIVDDLSTPATYVELDLDLLQPEYAPLAPLLAGAEDLSAGGAFEELLSESRQYAVGLRERFQRRVYDAVVGALVSAIYRAAPEPARGDTSALFDATFLLLYRLLFILYAEDRNLLPLGSAEYRAASLTEILLHLHEYEKSGRPWDTRATDHWTRLRAIFQGIAHGHAEWNVPAYDGGLFAHDAETMAGSGLLEQIALPNAALAPILLRLTFDEHEGESGKVDFSDLGIRYLGTLYEGLLAYDVRFADRDLAILGDEYVPASAKRDVAIKSGEPYLITPQGGRKVSGTYFTPSFVVRRLIDEALVPTLKAHLNSVAKLAPESAFAAMLEFRIVDPAMGSGHFLLDALDETADRMNTFLRDNPRITATPLAQARDHVTEIGKRYGIDRAGERVGDFELLRRIVLKNCIYGVDLAPMAVELAKLGLWLHAFVPALPLSYLGHTLRRGNSLLGVVGTELDDRFGGTKPRLFWGSIRSKLDEALEPAREIAARGDLSLRDIDESVKLQHTLEERLAPLRRAYDAYAARAFAQEARGPLEESLMGDIVDGGPLGSVTRRIQGSIKTTKIEISALIDGAGAMARELDAFHWELAFPEVFSRVRPGFDVVLGNPPWEEVTVERLGFYARYIPGIKSLRQREQVSLIGDYERKRPDVKFTYERELKSKERVRELIRSNFNYSRGSDPDLYRAFAELAIRISREGGAIGMVYPRQLLAANGSVLYRKALFPMARVVADFALNRRGWMFPDAHPQYTIVALTARKDGSGTIEQAGPAANEKAWSALPDVRTHWRYVDLTTFSEGAELPLFDDERGPKLFERMIANGRPFAESTNAARFRPWAPIHATNDRKNGLLKERARGARGWPVYTGRNFYLWEPEIGEPDFLLDPRRGLEVLQRKRLRSEVWNGAPQKVLDDPRTLPPNCCVILFRDVTNRTNSRTVIACLVPPERFAANQAPTLVQIGGDERDTALRLAVMCSVPFDWAARRRVELHMNFFVLNALPVPNIGPDDQRAQRAIECAARLACSDERFSGFAKACGVTAATLNEPASHEEVIAELDALVASMYGLDAADLETIFDDFTSKPDGVPPARREAVRQHFAKLQAGAVST